MRGASNVVTVALALALALAACTTTGKQVTARPDPTATAAPITPDGASSGAATPDDAKVVDVSGWANDWPKSWTDPRVVAALAKDCAFVPTKPRTEADGMGSIPSDVFTCRLAYEQSCTIDPCFGPSSHCEGHCAETCKDCGGACAASCSACKQSCKDDACRSACAKTCAECKQSCTRTMDRCVTGDCSKVAESCNARLKKVWQASGCTARCAVYKKCNERCLGKKDEEPCNAKCANAVSPKGQACLDKCDELRDKSDERGDECVLECYATAPCSPFLCLGWSPR